MSADQDGLERLIASAQVTLTTRQALTQRMRPGSPVPVHFAPEEFALLEVVSLRLVPHDPASIPLARMVDERLSRGDADGWRYDQLPPDPEAYRQLLAALPVGFRAADDEGRDTMLRQLQQGHPLIFEDLLAELTEGFYSQPEEQLRIGYVGFANAKGWHDIGLDQLDPHEREALDIAGAQP